MPLPYALDHVNIYLVQVDSGWVIVDTGLDSPRSRAIWAELFSGPLRGETVVGIFCTHFHVDHVGLAGYLAEQLPVPLFMTYEEYFSLRGWPAPTELPWQYREFFRQAGFPEERLAETLIMFDFSDEISPLPSSFIRMQEGGGISCQWRGLADHDRQRTFAGTCHALLCGERHPPLGRPAPAAYLQQCLNQCRQSAG